MITNYPFTLLLLTLTYEILQHEFPRKIFFLAAQRIQISIVLIQTIRKTVIYVSRMQIKTSGRAIFPAQSRGLTLSNGNTTTREIKRVLVYPLERLQRQRQRRQRQLVSFSFDRNNNGHGSPGIAAVARERLGQPWARGYDVLVINLFCALPATRRAETSFSRRIGLPNGTTWRTQRQLSKEEEEEWRYHDESSWSLKLSTFNWSIREVDLFREFYSK